MSISKEEKRLKEPNALKISANILYIIWNFGIPGEFSISYLDLLLLFFLRFSPITSRFKPNAY